MMGVITKAEFMYNPDFDFGLYIEINLIDSKNQGIMRYIQSRQEIKELFDNLKTSMYYEPETLIGVKVQVKENKIIRE